MRKERLLEKTASVVIAAALVISGIPGFEGLAKAEETPNESSIIYVRGEQEDTDSSDGASTTDADGEEGEATEGLKVQASGLAAKNGIINLNDDNYYRVNAFVSGQKYIIGVSNEKGSIVNVLSAVGDGLNTFTFTYTANSNDSEDGGLLGVSGQRLVCTNSAVDIMSKKDLKSEVLPEDGEVLEEATPEEDGVLGEGKPVAAWNYENDILSCNDGTNTFYVSYDNNTFSYTDDKTKASKVEIFTCGDTLSKCITVQPTPQKYAVLGEEFDAPTFSVEYNKDIEVDSLKWYVDDEEQEFVSEGDAETAGEGEADADAENTTPGKSDFKAYVMLAKDYGVYPVYCEITGHDGTYYYKEKTNTINYVICTGVLPNSFITFADVHQEFERIGYSIKAIMNKNYGMIPGLVICTGDWTNGKTVSDEVLSSIYMPQIKGALGCLDTVYVSGNHEMSDYTAQQNIAASLGATVDAADGVGVIYDSSSEAAMTNGRNSLSNMGLAVFGINYSAAEVVNEDGSKTYSYSSVIPQLDAFLAEKAANYKGELIVISAHSGLHVLGVQPESINDNTGESIAEWSGGNSYNVNDSDKMVELLNKYANDYNMNIMYFFGHDHSKQESEFTLGAGSEITSTVDFGAKTTKANTLQLTYAQAGCLSTSIGSANNKFTYVNWDDYGITKYLIKLGKNGYNIVNEDITSVDRKKSGSDSANNTTAATKSAIWPNDIYIVSDVVQKVQGEKQSFKLIVSTLGSEMTFTSDNNKITVDNAGYVTIEKNYIGSAVITITSWGENYTKVSKTITVNVIPKQVVIKKKKGIKKGFKLKWKKIKNVDGYEINYSTKILSKNKKIKSVTTDKKKIKVKKLKKKKLYYIRIRAFAKVKTASGNTKFYSEWLEFDLKTKKK